MIEPVIVALDHAGQALAQCDERDDQFGRIPKGRIEKTADAGTGTSRQLLGRATHPAGQGDDRDRRDDEQCRATRPPRHVTKRDRHWHREEENVEIGE